MTSRPSALTVRVNGAAVCVSVSQLATGARKPWSLSQVKNAFECLRWYSRVVVPAEVDVDVELAVGDEPREVEEAVGRRALLAESRT